MLKSLTANGGIIEMTKQNTNVGINNINVEEIYTRHVDMVYSVSFSYLKNTEDTKDIVSEIFLKLLQKKMMFNDFEHEKAWLIRTTINLCKDYLKRHSRKKTENLDNYENLESGDNLETDETYKLVMNLPEKYKIAIYLHYYEGYKTEEIGKILKKPQSTILSQLREARKLLKGVIENELD